MRTVDRLKLGAAVLLFALGMVAPLVTGLVVYARTDQVLTAVLAAGGLYLALIALVAVLFGTMKRYGWLAASTPLLLSALYALLPDLIPFPVDDGINMAVGAGVSFFLWLRKQPRIPKWIVIPLVAAVAYTWVGGLFPLPFDELLVYLASGLATYYGLRQTGGEPDEFSRPDVIEGEFVDVGRQ